MATNTHTSALWSEGNSHGGVRVEDIDWDAMADGDDMFNIAPSQQTLFVAVEPREIRRAETAPMVLTLAGTSGSLFVDEQVEPGQEYRYTENYHQAYYSQQPRDPRMLPPLTRRGGPVFTTDVANTRPSPVAPPLQKTLEPVPEQVDVSSLPPELRLSRYIELGRPDWGYAEIATCVPTFSKDQDGSRLVQRLLERAPCVQPIFEEVIALFESLCTDVFGNYVMQKMMEVCPKLEQALGLHEAWCEGSTTSHLFHELTPSPQLVQQVRDARMSERLTAMVMGNLLKYSREPFGCRVMQKAIENLRPEDRDVIIQELSGHVAECVLDTNANHVVQKAVEVCGGKAQFIVDEFLPKLSQLACNSFGCRVLQRTFERSRQLTQIAEKGGDVAALGGFINVRPILEKVLASVSSFTIHQYGNYVVQHGILNAPADLRHQFVEALIPQVYALSCSKFASNVAEKVVATADEAERDMLLDELTASTGSDNNNYLVLMMLDTYANYVVQRLLEACSEAQRARVAEVVTPHLGSIDQSVSGRHLLRKMESMGVVSNDVLLAHNIDVSSPEYGSGNNHKGGNRNNNNNGGGNKGGDSGNWQTRGGSGRAGAGRGRQANNAGGRQQRGAAQNASADGNNNNNNRNYHQQQQQQMRGQMQAAPQQPQPQQMAQASFQTFTHAAPQTLTYYPQGYTAAPLTYTPPATSLTPPQISLAPQVFVNGGFNNNGAYYGTTTTAQTGYYADPNMYAQQNYFVPQQQQQQQQQMQQPQQQQQQQTGGAGGRRGGGKSANYGKSNSGGRGQRRGEYQRA